MKLPIWLFFLLGFLSFGFTWIISIYLYVQLRCIEQGVTDKRLIFKSGLIRRKTEELRLGSVESIEIKQSILGRLLGYGDLLMSGISGQTVVFKFIKNPLTVKREIEEILDSSARVKLGL
jgi:uncharacterized membrane protein YdbT with pleckstrin-like domain